MVNQPVNEFDTIFMFNIDALLKDYVFTMDTADLF